MALDTNNMMNTETFERMVDELKALHEKLEKLRTFIDDKEKFEKLDFLNRDLLITQFKAMETYLSVLSIRIGLNAPRQEADIPVDGEAIESSESTSEN